HDGVRAPTFDSDLESEKIAFPRGTGVDIGTERLPVGFLGVQGVVLYGGYDPIALDPADRRANDDAGEQRIFACIFEVASVARIAREVGPAGKQNIETFCPRLGANHGAGMLRQFSIEGGRDGKPRGQWRRFVAGPHVMRICHAQTRVTLLERRYSKSRDALQIAGCPNGTVRLGLSAEGKTNVTVNELDL